MKNTIITLASVAALTGAVNAQTFISGTTSVAPTAGTALNIVDGSNANSVSTAVGWSNPDPGLSTGDTITLFTDTVYDYNGATMTLWDDVSIYATNHGVEDFSLTIGGITTNYTSAALNVNGEVYSLNGIGDSIIMTFGPGERFYTQIRELSFSGVTPVVPEPSSVALLGIGALGLFIRRRR